MGRWADVGSYPESNPLSRSEVAKRSRPDRAGPVDENTAALSRIVALGQ